MELLSGLPEERETDAVAPVLGACRFAAGFVGLTRALSWEMVGPEPLQGTLSLLLVPEAKRYGKLAYMMVHLLLRAALGIQKVAHAKNKGCAAYGGNEGGRCVVASLALQLPLAALKWAGCKAYTPGVASSIFCSLEKCDRVI